MKLDRNINGRGKYGLIKTRRLAEIDAAGMVAIGKSTDEITPELQSAWNLACEVSNALRLLQRAGVLDWGLAGTESEFFVIKLRDLGARAALDAYAAVYSGNGADSEYAAEIKLLALRAGPNSPFCKKPD